ncbi:MAG: hypothetical protein ACP5H2_01405 [Solirubrobacteraceae bacterium]
MATVMTATVGLVVGTVLWSLNVSGSDAMAIGVALVLALTATRNVAPYFLGRKDQ